MSGLFTRIARQAMGQARNPVRPVTSMTYQQSSELAPTEPDYPQSESSPDAVTKNPQATVESVPPPGIDVPFNAQTKAGSIDNADRLQTHDRPEQVDSNRVEPQPLISDSTGDPPVSRQTEDRIVPTNDIAAAITGIENTGAFDHQQSHAAQAESTASAMEKIIVDTLVEDQPRNFEASHQQQTSPADASPVEPGTPEPLLPSLAAAPTANSVAAMQTPAAASEAPNEVHVHIGRIEVTALQSSEAPKCKAKAAQQPMSLDDYLARRQRS